jgi:hypothetical protein
LVKLLNYDYFISTWSEGGGNQINGLVVLNYFPLIDTINFEERKRISYEVKGDFFDYCQDDGNGNTIYKYKKSYQEISEYFYDYIAYLEEREKKMYSIKYKTNK